MSLILIYSRSLCSLSLLLVVCQCLVIEPNHVMVCCYCYKTGQVANFEDQLYYIDLCMKFEQETSLIGQVYPWCLLE